VQGFDRVVSLLPSEHNLAAYDEAGLAWAHFPLPTKADPRLKLVECFASLGGSIDQGQKILLHQDELGDRLMGTTAGFLVWSGKLRSAPQAIALVEHVVGHHMGPNGRELVAVVDGLPPRARQ
jgi:hypothetical protein